MVFLLCLFFFLPLFRVMVNYLKKIMHYFILIFKYFFKHCITFNMFKLVCVKVCCFVIFRLGTVNND